MLASLLLAGIGGDLNVQISQAAFQMAYPVIQLLVTAVVPIAMTITLVQTIGRGWMNTSSSSIELWPILRLFLVLIGLLSYRALVPMVGDSVYWVQKAITGTASNAQAYATLQQLKPPAAAAPTPPTPQQVAQGQADEKSLISQMADAIGEKISAVTSFSLSDMLLGLATGLTAQLIQIVMLFIQAFLAGFLFVVGPIAWTLSMLPGWGGLMKSWFQSYLSVQMWSVTFAIINALFANYSQAQSQLMASQFNSVNDFMAAHAGSGQYSVGCIVFIIMYLLVPYMTSLIVGHAASDHFLSSAARMAASVATGGASAAAGGAAAGGGGAATAATAGGGGGGFAAFGFGGGPGGGGAGGLTLGTGGAGQAPPMLSAAGGGSPVAGRQLGTGNSALSTQTSSVGPARRPQPSYPGALGAASGSWGEALPVNPGAPNRFTTISSRDGVQHGTQPGTGELDGAASAGHPPALGEGPRQLPAAAADANGPAASAGSAAAPDGNSAPAPGSPRQLPGSSSRPAGTGSTGSPAAGGPPAGPAGTGRGGLPAAPPAEDDAPPAMPIPPPAPRGSSGSW